MISYMLSFVEKLVGKYKDGMDPINEVPLISNTKTCSSPVVQTTAASLCFYCGENYPYADYARCRGNSHLCSLCSLKEHLESCCLDDLFRCNETLQKAQENGGHAHVTEHSGFLSSSEYDLFTFLAIVPFFNELMNGTTTVPMDHDTQDASGDPSISLDRPPHLIPPCFTIVNVISSTDGVFQSDLTAFTTLDPYFSDTDFILNGETLRCTASGFTLITVDASNMQRSVVLFFVPGHTTKPTMITATRLRSLGFNISHMDDTLLQHSSTRTVTTTAISSAS